MENVIFTIQSDVFSYPTHSWKPKDIQFTVIKNKRKHQSSHRAKFKVQVNFIYTAHLKTAEADQSAVQ